MCRVSLIVLVAISDLAQFLAAPLQQSDARHLRSSSPADPKLIKELAAKKVATKEVHGELEHSVRQAVSHMNSAADIKHAISIKQAQLRASKGSRHILQDKVSQVDQVRDHLLSMLHKDMDPKIASAQSDLKKKQGDLQQEQEAVNNLKTEEDKETVNTDHMVKDLKATGHHLEELRTQVTLAKKEEETDLKKFDYERQMASQEIQSLSYAEKQHQSESSRLKDAEQRFQKLQASGEKNMRQLGQVEDARRDYRKEQDRAKDWEQNENTIKAKVAEMTQANKTSYDTFLNAQSREQQTSQQEAQEEKQFKLKQDKASHEESILKNVETKHQTEIAKLKVAETAVKRAEDKLQHLVSVRKMEEQKIEDSHTNQRNHLQQKIDTRQKTESATAHDIEDLGKQYAGWQQDQQKAVREVASKQVASKQASQVYEARLHDAYKTMHSK